MRSDRDEFAMQMSVRERKKSGSPPAKKKEPTPDLTDVVTITEKKRRLTQWDIKPPGYENVTAEQAKLSGKLHYAPLMLRWVAEPRFRHVSVARSPPSTANGSKQITGLHESAKWFRG